MDQAEDCSKCNSAEKKMKYYINPGYVLREIAGEYAIVSVDEKNLITNAMMVPNDSAVFLWNAFRQPSTEEDVISYAIQEYDASEEIIRSAVNRFVKELLKYEILKEVE